MSCDNVFNPVEDWDENDGYCLFFKLDAGEPPEVTSPLCSDWTPNYFTHFMRLPKEFRAIDDYVAACRASCIRSELDCSAQPSDGEG